MPFYHHNRRKVYGSEQLPDGYKILTTTEYAEKHFFTRNAVAKMCRCKKLKAYKSGGNWYIVQPRQN